MIDTKQSINQPLSLVGLSPAEMKASIEQMVAAEVPPDRHVAVIALATERGVRFAGAMRAGNSWILHADASFMHSDATPWNVTGEVGVVYSR